MPHDLRFRQVSRARRRDPTLRPSRENGACVFDQLRLLVTNLLFQLVERVGQAGADDHGCCKTFHVRQEIELIGDEETGHIEVDLPLGPGHLWHDINGAASMSNVELPELAGVAARPI